MEQLPSIIGIFISREYVQNPKLITFKDITQLANISLCFIEFGMTYYRVIKLHF
jgi:hypothetical protein